MTARQEARLLALSDRLRELGEEIDKVARERTTLLIQMSEAGYSGRHLARISGLTPGRIGQLLCRPIKRRPR